MNWSTLAFVSSSIPVIVCGLMLLMPESPRYLLMKKNKVAASKALQWLRGATSHEEVMEELNLVLELISIRACRECCPAQYNVMHRFKQQLRMTTVSLSEITSAHAF